MFNLGSGKNTVNLTLFDSEKECGEIGSEESKEKYVSLTEGVYRLTAHHGRLSIHQSYDREKYGYLCLELFTESGQRIASSRDVFSFPFQMVNFVLPQTLNLKIKVSRTGGTDRNKIHFYVEGSRSDMF
ncbi:MULTISPECIES: hypothetical protein [unclassified Microcoleus]